MNKQHKTMQFNKKLESNDGTISGLALRFDNIDSEGDKFAKDLKVSFGYNGDYDVFLYASHNPDYPFARKDNGTLKFERKEDGIHFNAKLNLDIQKDKDLYLMIKEGRVRGMSAGFIVNDYEEIPTGYKFTDITITEVSMTHIPADLTTSVKKLKEEKVVEKEILSLDDRLKML